MCRGREGDEDGGDGARGGVEKGTRLHCGESQRGWGGGEGRS